jgi:hypothetical protein
MTAHLAIARALHQGVPTRDGQAAEQLLVSVGTKQPEYAALPATVDRPQFWVIEQ